MSVAVLRGDARNLPLPDGCVDLVVTSPPYFGLRSYTDGGAHYGGQIGSEATPGEWLEALWACTAEWARVLKPEGSLFVNLGDKYNSAQSNHNLTGATARPRGGQKTYNPDWRGKVSASVREKSLLGLPWRYALGAVDRLGLILRAEIIWAKPNGLPESVTDRVRRAHEQVFHFTRQPRYYSAVDEIREPHLQPDRKRNDVFGGNSAAAGVRHAGPGIWSGPTNPLGKLPGSVWDIPSQPLTVPAWLGVDHFAAFPMELPRRIIAGWSPPGVCTACGQGRRPVSYALFDRQGRTTNGPQSIARRFESPGRDVRAVRSTAITGYTCACPVHPPLVSPSAPTRPAVVLDPFAGTGTTLLVAAALGRTGIGVDLSMDYCRLARWRTADPAERAKAMQVPKPPPVPDGQEALFTLEAL